MPANTYTIATANEMMIAIVPDGQDIAVEVARVAEEYGVTLEQYDTTTGLTLTGLTPTDAPMPGIDRFVSYGGKMGRLTDDGRIDYPYAVKLKEELKRRRHSDAELDAYFGGRAKYLQQLREELEAARSRLAGGFAADDARTAPEIRALFDPEYLVLWQQHREGVIRQLELALAANA